MTKILVGIMILLSLSIPTAAVEITAPEVPKSAADKMPENTESFSEALIELIQNTLKTVYPELENAREIVSEILIAAILFSLLPLLAGNANSAASIAGAAAISSILFQQANTMVINAADTVWEICEYGKLLCPVLATALAAQGGIGTSAALYAGTTAFITLLNTLVSGWFVPMVYLFLAFSITHCAFGQEIMRRFADAVKKILNWGLKTLLLVFTGYMSVTGVVSGATDAAALKAAKITVSSMVPVVGGILSDASEAILVSIATMKNAAGIYGILAILSVFMGPFIKIGIQYLILKLCTAVCSVFANKKIAVLVEDFSTAMELLLALVAAGSLMVLISTVCYMKGIG